MNVTVSIGRNIGSGPQRLREDDWDDFKAEVLDLFDQYGLEVYFSGQGLGQYGGSTEEAFTVVGQAPTIEGFRLGHTPGIFTKWYPRRLFKVQLARLAARYRQDSIALTFGEPEFVSASVPDRSE